MKLERSILGLAAEYAVASELCKRNVYAQLTLGVKKRTDILAETEKEMFRIQVKGKQDEYWPAVKGIYGKDMFLVLVDFQNKQENERPDFYILTVEDWKHFMATGMEYKEKVTIDERTNKPTKSDGFEGANVKPSMVTECLEKWEKIIQLITENSPP